MRRPTLLAVLIVALAAPAVASAANQTLKFDDVANGTTITDQYQSTYGIRFQRGFTGTQGIAAVAHTSPDATNYPTQSPPNELDFSTCGSGDFPTCGVELWAKLTKPQTTMSMRFGWGLARDTPPTSATMTITTYTINQSLIKTYSFPTPAHGPTQLVTLDKRDGAASCQAANPTCNDALPPIGYIHIEGDGSPSDYYRGAIDDLTLDTAVSDQGPSFGLTRKGGDTSEVKLVSGGSAVSVPLTIARDGGSNGNISFAASGLPSGVTATFSPNPYTGGDTGTITMTLQSSAGHSFTAAPITVTATPSSASAGSGPVSLQVPLRVQSTYDLDDVSLGVAQAVGPFEIRIEGRKTIARVTARALGATGGQADAVYGQLFGSRGGVPLPGSPLSPDVEPEPMLDQLGLPQEYNGKVGLTFTLPDSWTSGTVDFQAQVFDANPVSPGFVDTRKQVECGGCGGDNTSFGEITFHKTKFIDISPVQMTWTRNGVTNTPGAVGTITDAARITSPVSDANWGMRAYQGVIDISDIAALKSKDGDDEKNGKVWAALQTWEFNQYKAQGNKDTYGFFTMGINATIARGLTATYTVVSGKGATLVSKPMAVVDLNRPLSSVAHELGHAYGRLHADQTCGGQTKDAGGSDPDWPDRDGKMGDGYGVDTRTPAPGTAGVYTLFDPTKTYDFMSYCGNDSNEWISNRGWNQAYGKTAASRAVPRYVHATSAQAGGIGNDPSLLVSGFQVDGEKTYLNTPEPTTGSPGTQADSPFTAQAVDTSGDTIGSAKLVAVQGHADPNAANGEPAAAMTMLFGAVPTHGKQVGGLVVRNGGKVVGRVKASRHKPKVKVKVPKIPHKGKAPNKVTIRWKATDRDHDKLKVTVAYSTNGKRYRVIFMGPNHNKVTLPARLLTASKHARVRVRVTDGFHAAQSTSKRFVSRGAPPTARIVSPDPGTRMDSAAHLYLDGMAYDDAGYRLRSRSAVRWYDGSRLVGRGPVVSITGLRPGRHVLRLVARDRHGRTRSARRVVHILR